MIEKNPIPPVPPLPPVGQYQKKNGEFFKAFKWGSGISLGCFGPGCLLLIGLFFMIFAGIGASVASFEDEIIPTEKVIEKGGVDRIALIDVSGVIVRTDDNSGVDDVASSTDIINLLDKATEDKKVKAIIIKVNSPGGYVSPTIDIYNKIQEIQKSGKKVVVSMGDTAASGGYYMSASADKIYAEKTTTTGSLGVIMTLMNFQGLFDKYGYKEVVIKSGELKDMGSWSRDMTDEERKVFQHFIDEAYDDFVKAIAEGRKMDEAEVRKIADGRIYTGMQAKEIGLVDEVGDFWDAVDGAESMTGIKKATIVEYSKPPTLKDELLKNISKVTKYGIDLNVLKGRGVPEYKYQWIP